MRVVFLGTPDFAETVLQAILGSRHQVIAVVTQPDRPGHRNRLQVSPVKQLAEKKGIEVLQFEKIRRDGVDALCALAPDVLLSAAYGQILSQQILDIAPHGVINIHASLLPKYRGSSPIQWALINGERETGITVMQTALSVDSGDVLFQESIAISPEETGGSLFLKLAALGGECAVRALDLIESGQAVFTPQNHAHATHVPMLKKDDGKIDFDADFSVIDHFVRGMDPWPVAFATLEGVRFKIFKVEDAQMEENAPAGTVLAADIQNGLIVACKNGAVRIAELQPAGGKRMRDTDYLRGHSIACGAKFS